MEANGESSINKESPIPIYHQIAVDLRSRIAAREWELHDKLPSEMALSDHYAVSRITLRQALAELEQEGLITKQRGKGIFVSASPAPIIHDFSLPSALQAKLGQKGINLEANVLLIEESRPVASINQMLGLGPDEKLVFIKRTFLVEGKPIGLNRSWLPLKLVPDIVKKGLIDGHLSITLTKRYKLTPTKIENSIEAVRPAGEDLKIFNVPYDSPTILITSVSYLADQTPCEYSTTIWLSDSVKFRYSLST